MESIFVNDSNISHLSEKCNIENQIKFSWLRKHLDTISLHSLSLFFKIKHGHGLEIRNEPSLKTPCHFYLLEPQLTGGYLDSSTTAGFSEVTKSCLLLFHFSAVSLNLLF